MTQTLTNRVKAIKNTLGTGESADITEINAAFDKFDNHYVPLCKIRNSSQAIASGSTVPLVFNAITVDSYAARSEGPMADLANNRIIARKTGIYLIKLTTLWLSGTAAGLLRSNIAINSVVNNAVFDAGVAAAVSQIVLSKEVLTAGDTISASANQTTGVSRSLDNNTYNNIFELSAVWLGSAVEV